MNSNAPPTVGNGATNTATPTQVTFDGTDIVASSSAAGNGTIAGSPLTSDPTLAPLAANGGDTPTMAITNTSPAYNASGATCAPATDQRGITRPQFGACDIGAFELDTLPPPPGGGSGGDSGGTTTSPSPTRKCKKGHTLKHGKCVKKKRKKR